MQVKEAAQRRRDWGEKPCEHPRLEREYELETPTGDSVCVQCGWTFSPEEVEALKRAREPKKSE